MTRGTIVILRFLIAALALVAATTILQFYPGIWMFIKNNMSLPLMTFLVALVALLITAAEYYRKKSIDKKESRPYVAAEIVPEKAIQSMFELIIYNTGKTLAKNVSIKISPDHKQHPETSKSMNEIGVLKNLGIMTSGSVRKFYFGFYGEENEIASIKKQFTITVSYTDVTEKYTYEGMFICNPTDYDGMLQNSEKGVHDIYRLLEKLLKSHKDLVGYQKKLTDTIMEHGVRIRNLHTANLSSEELLHLANNTFTDGFDKEGWLRPWVYDFILLVKQARDSLLQNAELSEDKKTLLGELNQILAKDWYHSGEEVEGSFKKLNNILKR